MKRLLPLKGFGEESFKENTKVLTYTIDSSIVDNFSFGTGCFVGVNGSSSITMSSALKTELGDRVKSDKIDDMVVKTA